MPVVSMHHKALQHTETPLGAYLLCFQRQVKKYGSPIQDGCSGTERDSMHLEQFDQGAHWSAGCAKGGRDALATKSSCPEHLRGKTLSSILAVSETHRKPTHIVKK